MALNYLQPIQQWCSNQLRQAAAGARYQYALADDGGPIASLHSYEYAQELGHHAFATLRPDLLALRPREQTQGIYRQGGGQGSSAKDPLLAIYKAISEAIEYWAFLEFSFSRSYSFDWWHRSIEIDPTTAGVAALPFSSFIPEKIQLKQLQRRAQLEAIERWSICAWWEGELAHQKIQMLRGESGNIEVFQISVPWTGVVMLFVHSRSRQLNLPVYAFAADEDIDSALSRASTELTRNGRSLDFFMQQQNPALLTDLFEQRLHFFATDLGYQQWRSRLERPHRAAKGKQQPTCLLDRELPGPWSTYARVWRVLYTPCSDLAHNEQGLEYFLF